MNESMKMKFAAIVAIICVLAIVGTLSIAVYVNSGNNIPVEKKEFQVGFYEDKDGNTGVGEGAIFEGCVLNLGMSSTTYWDGFEWVTEYTADGPSSIKLTDRFVVLKERTNGTTLNPHAGYITLTLENLPKFSADGIYVKNVTYKGVTFECDKSGTVNIQVYADTTGSTQIEELTFMMDGEGANEPDFSNINVKLTYDYPGEQDAVEFNNGLETIPKLVRYNGDLVKETIYVNETEGLLCRNGEYVFESENADEKVSVSGDCLAVKTEKIKGIDRQVICVSGDEPKNAQTVTFSEDKEISVGIVNNAGDSVTIKLGTTTIAEIPISGGTADLSTNTEYTFECAAGCVCKNAEGLTVDNVNKHFTITSDQLNEITFDPPAETVNVSMVSEVAFTLTGSSGTVEVPAGQSAVTLVKDEKYYYDNTKVLLTESTGGDYGIIDGKYYISASNPQTFTFKQAVKITVGTENGDAELHLDLQSGQDLVIKGDGYVARDTGYTHSNHESFVIKSVTGTVEFSHDNEYIVTFKSNATIVVTAPKAVSVKSDALSDSTLLVWTSEGAEPVYVSNKTTAAYFVAGIEYGTGDVPCEILGTEGITVADNKISVSDTAVDPNVYVYEKVELTTTNNCGEAIELTAKIGNDKDTSVTVPAAGGSIMVLLNVGYKIPDGFSAATTTDDVVKISGDTLKVVGKGGDATFESAGETVTVSIENGTENGVTITKKGASVPIDTIQPGEKRPLALNKDTGYTIGYGAIIGSSTIAISESNTSFTANDNGSVYIASRVIEVKVSSNSESISLYAFGETDPICEAVGGGTLPMAVGYEYTILKSDYTPETAYPAAFTSQNISTETDASSGNIGITLTDGKDATILVKKGTLVEITSTAKQNDINVIQYIEEGESELKYKSAAVPRDSVGHVALVENVVSNFLPGPGQYQIRVGSVAGMDVDTTLEFCFVITFFDGSEPSMTVDPRS